MATEDYIVLRLDRWSEPSKPATKGGYESGIEVQGPGPTHLEFQELEIEEALNVAQEDDVAAVAPSLPLRLHEPTSAETSPFDTETATWGVTAVKADESPYSGKGVVVAVLDTGIEADHPAFEGVNLTTQNFTDEEDHDIDGHGTHCAGTIFGQSISGKRIGVAPGVEKALIAKVLSREGATTKALVSAIQWAVAGGAHVISMSIGIDFPGYRERLVKHHGFDEKYATTLALEGYVNNVDLYRTMAAQMKTATMFQQPTTIVAAAGNESNRDGSKPVRLNVAPPAAATGIRSVGAVGQSGDGYVVASFSNSKPDLVAPGVAVTSAALGGGLKAMNGTSMAAPHVTGVTALWAEWLKHKANRIDLEVLEAKVLAGADQGLLTPGFLQLDVGAGMVVAPLE